MTEFANFCRETFSPFSDLWLLKSLTAGGTVLIGYLFGADLWYAGSTIFVLTVIDTATAIWAAYASGDVITSKKVVQVIPKIIRYGLFMMSAHLVQGLIGFDVYIEEVVVAFLGFTEFVSIMENLAKTGMPIPMKLLNWSREKRDAQ